MILELILQILIDLFDGSLHDAFVGLEHGCVRDLAFSLAEGRFMVHEALDCAAYLADMVRWIFGFHS